MSLPTYGPWHSSDEMRRSWETDHDPVLGHPGVELERGDADLQGLAERREGVLGAQPAGAAVAFEIEGARRRRLRARAEHDERREGGGDTPGA